MQGFKDIKQSASAQAWPGSSCRGWLVALCLGENAPGIDHRGQGNISWRRRERFPALLASVASVAAVWIFVLAATGSLFAQTPSTTSACSEDPLSSACSSNTSSQSGSAADLMQGMGATSSLGSILDQRSQQGNQVYVDSAGNANKSEAPYGSRANIFFPPDPLIDMQRLARVSTGELLPVFGRDLFQRAPSTFAPTDQIPAMSDYVVGPGDVILLRLWGPESFNGQLTVDSTGSIYVPQVGAIHVAGLRIDQLESQIRSDVSHTFRNFDLSVNLGHLRSIQVYVVGEARRPGAYTISSLSTVLNVLFASGGPNVQGSLRHIQVRRQGSVVDELDLYDVILKGDESHDIRLQPEDTIFIPAVGPQVALAGSVHRPAIYELRGETTVQALLDLAGGFTPTASKTQISLERIADNRARAAMTVNLDAAGRATVLQDGDVLFANHITSGYQQSVTIRGNLANPGRFPWHPGMRLSDIIPDRMSLLTNNYWQQRNRLGVPVPLFEPLSRLQRTSAPGSSSTPTMQPNGADQTGVQGSPAMAEEATAAGLNQNPEMEEQELAANSSGRSAQEAAQAGATGTSEAAPSGGALAQGQRASAEHDVASFGQPNTITIPAPEIDWKYAVIERLDPITLKSSLVPFSLEKLLQDHDPAENLELQPGDIVTILSQADVQVPQDEQTKFVRLEGEFQAAGVYSVGPNETLEQLVKRAGGLTPKAYLYGSSFTRISAQVFQQQRLDEYITTVALNMQRAAAVAAASTTTGGGNSSEILEEQQEIAQLHKLRATGRVVLEFRPNSAGAASIPHIPLENGDVFRVPSRPLTVNVIGAVYGQNVFLYDPKRRVEDYVLLAGNPNAVADRKHAFIIRADGSVYSRERAQGPWKNSFDALQINPGDSIVIPEKPIRPSFVRQFIDYSQIFSQFALGAAAIAVIKDE